MKYGFKDTFTYGLFRFVFYGDWLLFKERLLDLRRGFVFLITFGKIKLRDVAKHP